MNFQDILKNILQEYNLTQTELAKIIGIKQSQISEWLKGKAKPGYDTLKLMAENLHISVDFLLGLEDDFGNITISKVTPPSPSLSDEEKQLLNLFRNMSHQQRVRFLAYGEGLIDAVKTNRLS